MPLLEWIRKKTVGIHRKEALFHMPKIAPDLSAGMQKMLICQFKVIISSQ